MWAELARRASGLTEAMDAPDCDPARLERTYQQFSPLNRVLSGWESLYRAYIRPELAAGASTLLDIGCGGGDILRLLTRFARRDGFEVRGLGIDPDPRAIAYATAQQNSGSVRFLKTDSSTLSETFDLVLSNHVLHHLTDKEVTGFCRESQRLAGRLALHNDIHRGCLAYTLFPLTGLILRDSYIVPDGLISIRRSFREAELKPLLPEGWTTAQHGAFRLQALWKP